MLRVVAVAFTKSNDVEAVTSDVVIDGEVIVWVAFQVFALLRLSEMVPEPPSEIGEPDTVRPPPFESAMVEFASPALGSPVQLVSTPEAGVPRAGAMKAMPLGVTTVPVNVGEARLALRLFAVVTKAVVARAVVLFPAVCVVPIEPVGRVGVPVNVGEASAALAVN